ncbi:Fic family protein [Micrococcus terreus]|uniref:Fic family protein n=1 Tax=Micrococcus terreus TaxID=574650 RepID=UPI0021A81AFF|nr:Fic family protein [Micrococcus terreus]MCT2089358.1 Fic family protein [Micrococcus terreus]
MPATIAALPVHTAADVAAAAEDALQEITRFDAELAQGLSHLGGDSDGELAPLSAVLLRTESASSSQIENVTAGAKALALAALQEKTGTNATLVAANVDAMQRAADLSDELTLDSMLAVHRTLLHGADYAEPGSWRSGQVRIGANAPTPHRASFVPPHSDRVVELLQDLIDFCHRTDVPVLQHVALAHAQFETIHPFADGNGRTGRVLVHTMLHRAGVTRRLTVPVSAGLLQDTESYFRALTAYREGEIEPIIARFTEAAFAGVGNGRALVSDLQSVTHGWLDVVTARRHATVWRVLPVLAEQPAVTVPYLQRRLDVSQPAAQHAVDQLLDADILTPTSAGRRNRVWVAQEIVDALDGFAARARRR